MDADIKAYNQEVFKNLNENKSASMLDNYKKAYYKLRYPYESSQSPGGYMNTDF